MSSEQCESNQIEVDVRICHEFTKRKNCVEAERELVNTALQFKAVKHHKFFGLSCLAM